MGIDDFLIQLVKYCPWQEIWITSLFDFFKISLVASGPNLGSTLNNLGMTKI